MSSYESYLKKAQNSAKKQQKEYETQRNKQLQKTINALASAAATEQKALRQTHAQQSKATKQSYEGLFDRNAIQEAVSRKTVAERMANLGLTDSGLNRSQQTAISVTRSKADANTSLQQQSALDALASQLATALADSNRALEKDKAAAVTAAQSDIQSNLSQLLELAARQAGDHYETDVAAQTARKKAELEAQQAAKELETALKKAQIAAEQADRQAAKEAETELKKARINAQAKLDAAKTSADKGQELKYITTYLDLLAKERAYQSPNVNVPYQAVVKLLQQKIFGF
ncbi:MAG: hypothetical protein IJC17_05500 [Clostridia bacterium]|nr:hypothetical protein [Clostridia bacterium]